MVKTRIQTKDIKWSQEVGKLARALTPTKDQTLVPGGEFESDLLETAELKAPGLGVL